MIRRVEKPSSAGSRKKSGGTERATRSQVPPPNPDGPDGPATAQAQLEILYSHVPVGLCVLDREFRYVKLNQRLADMNGLSIARHIGHTVREIEERVGNKLEPILRKVLKTGEPATKIELREPKPTPGKRHCAAQVSLYPIKTAQGRTIGIVAIVLDIWEQEEQLRRYAEDLEKSVSERTATLQESIQSLESVLYHVAHDLRAPLRAMQGLTTLLLEEYAPHFDAEGREYAGRIVAAANQMDALIRDLLAYGHLGHVTLPLRPLETERLMKVCLDSMRDEIVARGARVEIQHPLPACCANETLLQQVLCNLLSNALKFVAPGVVPHVIIWGEHSDGKVRISILDNGIGIQAEHQDRIFRVFERLHRAEDFPGTGIGLAIVWKGVERMGGHVGLESRPGHGSCFWVELPEPPCPKKHAKPPSRAR